MDETATIKGEILTLLYALDEYDDKDIRERIEERLEELRRIINSKENETEKKRYIQQLC